MKESKNSFVLKILIVIVAVLFFPVCLAGCKSQPLQLNAIIDKILSMEKVSDCKIISLNDYKDIHIYLKNPVISQVEVEKYIEEELKDYEQNEITDDFVKINFNCDTVEQYKQKIMQNLTEEKKIEIIVDARKQVMDKLLELSTFSLNKDEIMEYSLDIIQGYEMEAYLYDMSLSDYSEKILKIPYDKFFEMCYEESELIIKTYLIIGAISEKEKFTDEYNEENIYLQYQELENNVYSLFIKAEEGF